MKYSQSFLTHKDYSVTSVFESTWYLLVHRAKLSYHPRLVSFNVSLVEKLFPGLTSQNFWKFYIFLDESISLHWGTETRCTNFNINCWIFSSTLVNKIQTQANSGETDVLKNFIANFNSRYHYDDHSDKDNKNYDNDDHESSLTFSNRPTDKEFSILQLKLFTLITFSFGNK